MLETDFLSLLLDAGPVAKIVLGILGLFSIVCWAIVFERGWQLGRMRRKSNHFLKRYVEKIEPSVLYGTAKECVESPLACIFISAFEEMSGGKSESVYRSMRRTASKQISKLEKYLPVLATTASCAPFIGLFGTVWGIMESFRNIGAQGSANLAVVAPGISEALIATAAGLAAAIPAVMAYNFFVNRVKYWAGEMDMLSLEILNEMERKKGNI